MTAPSSSADSAIVAANPPEPTSPQRRRRRWSAEQKAQLLASFAASGLTALEFSRRNGLAASTLFSWVERQRAPRPAALTAGFAAVRLAENNSTPIHSGVLLLQLGADVTLAVPLGVDAEWLGRLLRATRPC